MEVEHMKADKMDDQQETKANSIELSTKQVLKILTGQATQSNKVTLFELEKNGKIPTAKRKSWGKIKPRYWTTSDLPRISDYFHFLQRPKNQKLIAFYAPKGGVWKTTTAYNFARILALHGIKTLIIGLDSQISITSLCEQSKEIIDLKDYKKDYEPSLYEFFENNLSIDQILKKTDLEYLYYIPETDDLDRLSVAFTTKRLGEFQVKERLIPALKGFDVVIFDNPPAYSNLSIASIIASDYVITPLGCEIEAYKAVDRTMMKLFTSLRKDYKLDFKQFYIPTKLDNTNISQQIKNSYQNLFLGEITLSSLRTAVAAQEASLEKKSIFEHDSDSLLANDYHEVIKTIWSEINK